MNILVNAVQALDEDGEITIRTRYENGKVYISFKDNGMGIPQENLQRIFDPGFTTKGVGIGTGLGLSGLYAPVHREDLEYCRKGTLA